MTTFFSDEIAKQSSIRLHEQKSLKRSFGLERYLESHLCWTIVAYACCLLASSLSSESDLSALLYPEFLRTRYNKSSRCWTSPSAWNEISPQIVVFDLDESCWWSHSPHCIGFWSRWGGKRSQMSLCTLPRSWEEAFSVCICLECSWSWELFSCHGQPVSWSDLE